MFVQDRVLRRSRRVLGGLGVGCLLLGATLQSQAQDKVIASINGEIINQSDFYGRLERLRGQDFVLPTSPPTLRGETAGMIAMNLLLNQHLVMQLAAKLNALPTDAEVDAEMETVLKQDQVKKALADKLVLVEDLKADVKVQLARFKLATVGVTETDAELEEWYNKHKAEYIVPEKWGLSVIRTDKMEDLPKIQMALKSLSFPTVARSYSQDERTKVNGGSMGLIFPADPNLPETIRSAVRKINVGEVTPPIETEFDQDGKKIKVWWFVRLDQKDGEVVHPLVEVKTQAMRRAMLEKAGGFKDSDKKLADFRDKAEIKINLPGYEALLGTKPK